MNASRSRLAPAREAAFHALRAIAAQETELGEALSRSRDPLSDQRDRALATDLVTGTLRWRGAIDYQLARRARTSLDRLDPPVVDALRLGAYQILHLHRVPVSAAVNDSVELVKRARLTSAATFVNGVLRRLARERDALVWPERPASDTTDADRAQLAAHFAVVHSHPQWLVERWLDRYGAGIAEAWLRFNNHPARLTLAANRLRLDRETLAAWLRDEGFSSDETAIAPAGLLCDDAGVLTAAAVRDGAAVVQDEASQIIPELVRAAPGARVLDACAAPGGKTLALAAQAGPTGLIVAADVRPRRVRLLASTIARTGADRVRIVHVSDRGDLPFAETVFERVLVDAPCSGLGTLRRDPDIRWRRTPPDLPRLAATQRELLDRVAPFVAVDGRLVYSTCSSEPEENEDVVAAFLGSHPEFRLLPVGDVAGLPPAIAALATPAGDLRTTPVHGLEAFYGAVLQRTRRGHTPHEGQRPSGRG